MREKALQENQVTDQRCEFNLRHFRIRQRCLKGIWKNRTGLWEREGEVWVGWGRNGLNQSSEQLFLRVDFKQKFGFANSGCKFCIFLLDALMSLGKHIISTVLYKIVCKQRKI